MNIKRVSSLVGILLSLASVALADPWTDGGSSVYVTDTSDSAGIGTTSPGTKIQVSHDANSVFGLRLINTYSGGHSWTLGDGHSAHGGFSIYDETASADRLFISSAGRVGIGTYSPGTKLELDHDANASDFGLRLVNTYSGGHSWTIGDGRSAHGGFSIYDETGSADRFYISSGGNVGIGTTSPGTKMQVSYDGNSVLGLRLVNTYTGGRSWTLGDGRSSHGGFSIYDETSSADRFYIASGGSIGIGTTSPGTKLDVNGDATLNNTLYSATGTNLVLQAPTGKDMIIRTDGGTEWMRVTSAGNVGVRGATPNSTTDFALGDSDTGLDQVSDGILGVKTNNTEALRVNSNQDIRIGSSTGTGRLYVEKNDQWAIYGQSSAGSDDYGSIYGETSNAGNYNSTGVYGVTKGHGNADGQPLGIRGDARYTGSPAGGQFGVLGYNYSQGNGADVDSAGVWGGSVGTPGSEGEFATYGNGVQGETYSKNNTSGGGIFLALSDDGQADGVVGKTYSNNGNSYGVYSSGDFGASGSKSAVVYTESQGPTQLYAEESAEVYFSDYGESQLSGGSAKILLDPLFLETVTISDDELYYVFIQSYGDAVMSVQRSADSFEVNKVYGSNDNAQFSYRIVAKRKYYEDRRLLPTKVEIDYHMRPDLGEAEIGSLNDRWVLQYFTREELLPDLQSESEKLFLKD